MVDREPTEVGRVVRLADLPPDQKRIVRPLLAAATDAGERARIERAAQNLPATVTDPAAIQRVAAICRSASRVEDRG